MGSYGELRVLYPLRLRLVAPARPDYRSRGPSQLTDHDHITQNRVPPTKPPLPLPIPFFKYFRPAAMNGSVTTTATTPAASPRTAKSPPTFPAPTPPSGSARQLYPAAPAPTTNGKSKRKADPAPVDPAAMYESLRNRIAALEEEEEFVEEEERRFGACICPPPSPPDRSSLIGHSNLSFFMPTTAEEAQKHVRGLEENAVHVKYIELVRPCRRPFAPRSWVLSAYSLQSSSAWSASTRRRNRSC